MKLQVKSKEHDKRVKIVNEEKINVKMPKLIITTFDGSSLELFRLWSKFEREIDKAEIDPISKFSYLKELLISRVRLLIDHLPFTSEGFQEPNLYFLESFGNSNEITAAHIQFITSLPVIQNSHPNRIHDFYEKLAISVQALKTMNKLKK